MKTGDILVAQWGYSMIIVSFFEVTKATEKSVMLCELASKEECDGFLTGTAKPVKGKYIKSQWAEKTVSFSSKPFMRRVKTSEDGRPYIAIADYVYARPYEENSTYNYDHCD